MLHACPAFVQFVPLSSRLVRRRCRLVMASSETSDLREPLLSPTAGMEQNPDLAVRTHVDSHDATSPTHAVTSPANDYDSPFAVQFPQTPAFPDPVAQLAPVKTGTSRSDGNRVSLANKASMLPPLGRVVPGTTNRPPPGAMKSRLPASMGLGATLGSKDTVGLQRKERFVKLPPPKQPEPTEAGAATQDDDMDSWMVEASPTPLHGRVTVHALCEKFDKARLKELVRLRTGQDYVQWKYEALYTSYVDSAGNRQPEDSAIIFFEYGVVAFWGLTDAAEADVIRSLAKPCYISPLPPTFYEKDDIAVRYSSTRQPNMHNDVITISDASRYDRSIKIAISHALSQSTKLSVYEKMIQGQIDTVIHLPAELASTGMVKLTRKEIAQHIGGWLRMHG
eukprot:jgi/Mesvir1/18395/Mv14275-RA.2